MMDLYVFVSCSPRLAAEAGVQQKFKNNSVRISWLWGIYDKNYYVCY